MVLSFGVSYDCVSYDFVSYDVSVIYIEVSLLLFVALTFIPVAMASAELSPKLFPAKHHANLLQDY